MYAGSWVHEGSCGRSLAAGIGLVRLLALESSRESGESRESRESRESGESGESGEPKCEGFARRSAAVQSIQMRRTHALLADDFLRRGDILPQELSQHANGRGWRRGALREAVVQLAFRAVGVGVSVLSCVCGRSGRLAQR